MKLEAYWVKDCIQNARWRDAIEVIDRYFSLNGTAMAVQSDRISLATAPYSSKFKYESHGISIYISKVFYGWNEPYGFESWESTVYADRISFYLPPALYTRYFPNFTAIAKSINETT